jgi:hypothetical protein
MLPTTDPYKNTCSQIISSSCVKWPVDLVLSYTQLSKGDSITEVITELTVAITDVKNSIDTSNLDLDCLDECSCILECEDDPPLVDIVQCLIKEHCDIKAKVDGIDEGIIYDDLDFNCVDTWTSTIRNIDHRSTQSELYNYLVTLICEVFTRTKNDNINLEITDIKSRLTELETKNNDDNPDDTTSLVTPGCHTIWSQSVEEPVAISLLANRVKALERTVLINERTSNIQNCDPITLDVDGACISTITDALGGWGYDSTMFDSATSVEGMLKAMIEVNCALVQRMTGIYDNINTCCGKSCEDYDVSLRTVRGFDSTSFTVVFNGADGIPNFGTANFPQFTQNGSQPTVRAIDATGTSQLLGFSFNQMNTGFTIDDSLLTQLDLTTNITFILEFGYTITNDDGSTHNCSVSEYAIVKIESGSECWSARYIYSSSDDPGADAEIEAINDLSTNPGSSGLALPAFTADFAATPGMYSSHVMPTTCNGTIYTPNTALQTLYNNIDASARDGLDYITAEVATSTMTVFNFVFSNKTTAPYLAFYDSRFTFGNTVTATTIECPTCV